LTPVLDGAGRARLLNMVPGRSATVLKTGLSARSPQFRPHVEVVAMGGFDGYKTAARACLYDLTWLTIRGST
jgi:transposase